MDLKLESDRPSRRPPVGVLLGQVGTPAAPTSRAVGRYLARFLSDPRVVDYPAWLWQPLLRGIILPFRSRKSAALYQRIWTAQGSPLLTISLAQRAALQQVLGDGYRVVLGMAYDGPPFTDAIDELELHAVERIVAVPMFPQYSSATTASIYDAVNGAVTGATRSSLRRAVPAVTYVPPFYDHPAYIRALTARLRSFISEGPAPDHFVVSFHGLPQRYVDTGDPYRNHCEHTLALIAREMQWTANDYTLCFQSRFGRERWLEPETARLLGELPRRGVRSPLVITPGFTTDCLETLDELGNEGRKTFTEGGGDPGRYRLCPCLNDYPAWIACMKELVEVNAGATKP